MEIEIIQLVAKSTIRTPEGISRETLLEDIGWDSLAILEFMADCDTQLGISLDSAELRKAKTVGDLIETVEQVARSS